LPIKSKAQEEAGWESSDGSTACPNTWNPCTEGNMSSKPGALGVSTAALGTSPALQPNPSFTF